MSEGFVPTSLMHRKAHAPDHMVRIYDTYQVNVVCRDCGMHDWGDWSEDDGQSVERFKAKYGDRVLEVVTMDDAVVELWTCAKHDADGTGYLEEHLTPVKPDGTRGHLIGPDIDGTPVASECAGPVDGPVKGF